MMQALINGQSADSINIADRGLTYGDGLFETMSVRNGSIALLDDHLKRLQLGCRRLGIECPDEMIIKAEIQQLCSDMSRSEQILKLIVTRGPGERGYAFSKNADTTRILVLSDKKQDPKANDYRKNGISLMLCQTRLSRNSTLAGMKHLNRLEQVLAAAELQNTDYMMGLMLDTEDNVIESTIANIFINFDGDLHTPDLSYSGIAGVMRHRLIDYYDQLKVKTICRDIKLEELNMAQEILVCNSSIGVWPVKDFNGCSYEPGALTKTLQNHATSLLNGD